jgi:hypothetical protein
MKEKDLKGKGGVVVEELIDKSGGVDIGGKEGG